jgi:hypothetical protein
MPGTWTVQCLADEPGSGKGAVVATWTDGVKTFTHTSRHATEEMQDQAAVAAWKSEVEAALQLYLDTEAVADHAAAILTEVLNGSH